MGACLAKCRESEDEKDDTNNEFAWEKEVLDEAVRKTDKSIKAAIVSYGDVTLRASVPKGFKPNQSTLKRITAALEGDVDGLTKAGINLMSGTRQYTPAKIDRGKALYGTDGQGGGCAIFKTKECLLIVVYKSNPAVAMRLASEVAEYMEEHDC